MWAESVTEKPAKHVPEEGERHEEYYKILGKGVAGNGVCLECPNMQP